MALDRASSAYFRPSWALIRTSLALIKPSRSPISPGLATVRPNLSPGASISGFLGLICLVSPSYSLVQAKRGPIALSSSSKNGHLFQSTHRCWRVRSALRCTGAYCPARLAHNHDRLPSHADAESIDCARPTHFRPSTLNWLPGPQQQHPAKTSVVGGIPGTSSTQTWAELLTVMEVSAHHGSNFAHTEARE